MTRIATPLWLLLLVACTPPGEPPDSIPAPDTAAGEPVRGTVRVVGSAPVNVQVVLQPPSGRALRLVGPLAGELERLAGVEVAVRGRVEPSPDPMVDRQLRVAGYEIVSVAGRPVVMGEIIAIQEGWVRLRTEAGEEVFLSGAPSQFRVGQKVWVQGPRSIAVQSYGMIRP
jgi:hypothetical protein